MTTEEKQELKDRMETIIQVSGKDKTEPFSIGVSSNEAEYILHLIKLIDRIKWIMGSTANVGGKGKEVSKLFM